MVLLITTQTLTVSAGLSGGCRDGLAVGAPTTATEYALEELSLSHHKRPFIHHLFLCPRLYTHAWRKRLFKLVDFVFYLPAGRREAWPTSCYEPLIVAIFLPFQENPPWTLCQLAPLLQLDKAFCTCWRNADDDTSVLTRLWHVSA
jgi:hypothetical protein